MNLFLMNNAVIVRKLNVLNIIVNVFENKGIVVINVIVKIVLILNNMKR